MSALPVTVNLTVYHGDSWSQYFRLRQGETPLDLTGATVASWARPAIKSPVVPLTAAIVDPPTSGVVVVSAPASGPLLPWPYAYDLEITAAGQVTTWIRGQISVTSEITNAEV